MQGEGRGGARRRGDIQGSCLAATDRQDKKESAPRSCRPRAPCCPAAAARAAFCSRRALGVVARARRQARGVARPGARAPRPDGEAPRVRAVRPAAAARLPAGARRSASRPSPSEEELASHMPAGTPRARHWQARGACVHMSVAGRSAPICRRCVATRVALLRHAVAPASEAASAPLLGARQLTTGSRTIGSGARSWLVTTARTVLVPRTGCPVSKPTNDRETG